MKLSTDVVEVIVRQIMKQNEDEIRRVPFKTALVISITEKRSTFLTIVQGFFILFVKNSS